MQETNRLNAETKAILGDDGWETTHYEPEPTPPDFKFGERKHTQLVSGFGLTSTDFNGKYFHTRVALQHFWWARRRYDLGLEATGRVDVGYHSYELGAKPASDTVAVLTPEMKLWYRQFAIGGYLEGRAGNYDKVVGSVFPGISASAAYPGAARAGGSAMATIRYSPASDIASPLQSIALSVNITLFHLTYERQAVDLPGGGVGILSTYMFGVLFGM